MLNKQDIIKAVSELDLDIILMHGASMVIRGVKEETNDIDCMPLGDIVELPLTVEVTSYGEVHSFGDFDFGVAVKRDIEYDVIDGLKCQTLNSIIEDKLLWNRPKDQEAIALIMDYLNKTEYAGS